MLETRVDDENSFKKLQRLSPLESLVLPHEAASSSSTSSSANVVDEIQSEFPL
jgi:hypothetical protein